MSTSQSITKSQRVYIDFVCGMVVGFMLGMAAATIFYVVLP